MTVETPKIPRRLWALTVAIGALALAGCATTHIGEDWQCPLAQGTQCTSVAGADPAVQAALDKLEPAEPVPLNPTRGLDDYATASKADAGEHAGRPKCAAGCNPFAIFARLIPGGPSGGPGDSSSPDGESEEEVPSADSTGAGPGDGGIEGSIAPGTDPDLVPNRDLRTPETIGRVWIAPYVDAGGVYREASWVRIVIAPARWRHP